MSFLSVGDPANVYYFRLMEWSVTWRATVNEAGRVRRAIVGGKRDMIEAALRRSVRPCYILVDSLSTSASSGWHT